MSQIQTLVNLIHHYQSLPHHRDASMRQALGQIQAWQRDRIHRTHRALFDDPKTAPLANYLIHRIYDYSTFDAIASQLLTAGQNALNGSGKLEKLVPKNALATGLLSIRAAITAIELDLALAEHYLAHHFDAIIDEALMIQMYQAVNAKDQRIAQIHQVGDVCQACYQSFNSYLLYQAFKLAKSTAHANGYQPLYDFIHDGLVAIRAIDHIERFSQPFTRAELAVIHDIHDGMGIDDDLKGI